MLNALKLASISTIAMLTVVNTPQSSPTEVAAPPPPARAYVQVEPEVVPPPRPRRATRHRPTELLRAQAWANTWAARTVAKCESGHKGPRAVNPSGKYRGKWQFDGPTWRSVGGKGDPARVSEAYQDLMAYRLWLKRGWQPWECRKKL